MKSKASARCGRAVPLKRKRRKYVCPPCRRKGPGHFHALLVAIEPSPEGRVLVVEQAFARQVVDGRVGEDGEPLDEHELVPLKGRRFVRMDYVVELGPCTLEHP